MIDTLMVLWNRGYGSRWIPALLAFLLICISISLLLVTVDAAWWHIPPQRSRETSSSSDQPGVGQRQTEVTGVPSLTITAQSNRQSNGQPNRQSNGQPNGSTHQSQHKPGPTTVVPTQTTIIRTDKAKASSRPYGEPGCTVQPIESPPQVIGIHPNPKPIGTPTDDVTVLPETSPTPREASPPTLPTPPTPTTTATETSTPEVPPTETSFCSPPWVATCGYFWQHPFQVSSYVMRHCIW